MNSDKLKKGTVCVHNEKYDYSEYKGVTMPVFTATAYEYMGVDKYVYPRYFNTPNSAVTAAKLARLEGAEDAILFSSGMAATITVLMSFLETGDHVLLQNDIYGGTHDSVRVEMERIGVKVTFADANPDSFRNEIRPDTKVIFIESPSNPLLNITDIRSIVKLAREHNILTVFDNTFATPLNQNPHELGIDIVIHSGTKYLSGHSDLSCGVATSAAQSLSAVIRERAIHFGGNLDAQATHLLERSLKTLQVRVEKQNQNALNLAKWMEGHPVIKKVNYPGLQSHHQHELAKSQMSGFGGMLSFEVKGEKEIATEVVKKLKLIKPVMSLGGVESTITSPVQTSHARMSPELREKLGITPQLLRLSVGIEDLDDLKGDLKQAFDCLEI